MVSYFGGLVELMNGLRTVHFLICLPESQYQNLKVDIVIWGWDTGRIDSDQPVPFPGLPNLGKLWMTILVLSPHRNSKGKKLHQCLCSSFSRKARVVGSSSLFPLSYLQHDSNSLLAKCSEMKGTTEMKITYYYGIIFRDKFSIIFRDMLPPSI